MDRRNPARMQKLLVALLLALTALSGCLNADDSTDDGDDGSSTPADTDGDGFADSVEQERGTDPNDATSKPTPPEAIHEEGTAQGAAICDPGVVGCVQGSSCTPDSTPSPLPEQDLSDAPDPSCVYHEFTIDDSWTTTVTLTPGSGTVTDAVGGNYYGTDYDLFLYKEGNSEPLGESTNAEGQVDTVSKKLAAGTYVVEIVAWHNFDATYTLDIVFS